MNRKEQIQEASGCYEGDSDDRYAFIQGAEWADANPTEMEKVLARIRNINTRDSLNNIRVLEQKLTEVERQRDIAVEALEFYSKMERGIEQVKNPEGAMPFGTKAKEALAKIKEKS